MTRDQVLQQIINATGARTYVEIGIAFGATFLNIRAARKIGIEPVLAEPAFASYFRRFPEITRHVYAETSDIFFARHSRLFMREKIDVAFVDGFHSYRQSLRDVLNCLRHLSPLGVIILDDCNPHSEFAARTQFDRFHERILPVEDRAGKWCADVWKTIVRIRSTRSDLDACVLDCAEGMGIIRKKQSQEIARVPLERINRMTYQNLKRGRVKLLNLKRASYIATIVRSVATNSLSIGSSR